MRFPRPPHEVERPRHATSLVRHAKSSVLPMRSLRPPHEVERPPRGVSSPAPRASCPRRRVSRPPHGRERPPRGRSRPPPDARSPEGNDGFAARTPEPPSRKLVSTPRDARHARGFTHAPTIPGASPARTRLAARAPLVPARAPGERLEHEPVRHVDAQRQPWFSLTASGEYATSSRKMAASPHCRKNPPPTPYFRPRPVPSAPTMTR